MTTEREETDGTAEGEGKDDADTVQVWLVERGYTNRDLITLTYATRNGERVLRKERAAATMTGSEVTAAREADPDRLAPVTDEETVERYRKEAARTMEKNDPDEAI